MLPNSKLIILLRNPKKRGISEFNHNCKRNRYIRTLKSISIPFLNSKNKKNNKTTNQTELNEINEYNSRKNFSVFIPKGSVLLLSSLEYIIDSAYLSYLTSTSTSTSTSSSSYPLNLFLSPIPPPSLHSTSSTPINPMWKLNRKKIEDNYGFLSYPCQPKDFTDFYFGSEIRVNFANFNTTGSKDDKKEENQGNRKRNEMDIEKRGGKGKEKEKEKEKSKEKRKKEEREESIIYLLPPIQFNNNNYNNNSRMIRNDLSDSNTITYTQIKSYEINNSLNGEDISNNESSNYSTRKTNIDSILRDNSLKEDLSKNILHEHSLTYFSIEEASHGYYDDQLQYVLDRYVDT